MPSKSLDTDKTRLKWLSLKSLRLLRLLTGLRSVTFHLTQSLALESYTITLEKARRRNLKTELDRYLLPFTEEENHLMTS